jgi:signal transduction histidine kinase
VGRLFWKFFFFFWLAQIVTSASVGTAIWLLRPEREPSFASGDFRPPPHAQPLGLDRLPPPPLHEPPPDAAPPGPPPHGGPAHGNPFLRPPLMPILAGSVVSVFFAALLAWYFARPIRSLRAAFAAVAGGKLHTRVGAAIGRRRDELADLGGGFDRMAERLQGLLDSQRRLLHDVSHELRSPLARLQAAADLLRQQPERSREYVERIEREAARMDRLVGELLTLARLDAGTAGKLDEEVDVHEIITQIAADAQFEAQAKGCLVTTTLRGELVVAGSGELIYRAVENVVRNAVRHAPANGRIDIEAAPDECDRRLRITVADNGPGVPEADLEAIFEPFARSGGADSFTGYGLGLAITRRVMTAHGGTVVAANRAQGGLVVTLTLPVLAA